MKNYYVVSLVKGGLLGGGLLVSQHSLTYKTGKVSVTPEIRNLVIAVEELRGFSTGRLFVFPTVTLHKKDGGQYRFVVFAKKALVKQLTELCGLERCDK